MYRTSSNAKIGGVCAAIAEKFGLKVNMVRLAFVIGTIITEFIPGIAIYLLLCTLIPKVDGPGDKALVTERLKDRINRKAERLARKQERIDRKRDKIISNLEAKGGEVVERILNEIRGKASKFEKTETAPIKKENTFTTKSRIQEIVENINKISSSILEREKSNPIVNGVINEFKEKIVEFQSYSPSLEKQYIVCSDYLRENSIDELNVTINDLKAKIDLSSEGVKTNYVSILEQKEKRLEILTEIKEYTEIIEAKLYLILNTLQNIEASVVHAELQTQLPDENYDDLQSQITILTGNMSEMSDIFRKSKIRL